MPGSVLGLELKRTLRRLVIATAIVYLAVIAISVLIWTEGNQTNAALCTFKQDLERRVDQSKQFIESHPNGFAGISPKVIQVTISNEERSVHSLHELGC